MFSIYWEAQNASLPLWGQTCDRWGGTRCCWVSPSPPCTLSPGHSRAGCLCSKPFPTPSPQHCSDSALLQGSSSCLPPSLCLTSCTLGWASLLRFVLYAYLVSEKHKRKNSCCNKLPDLSFSVWLGCHPSSPEQCSAVPKPPKLWHLVGFQLEQKPAIYSKERTRNGACGRCLHVVMCSMALSLSIEKCRTPWKNCWLLVLNSLVIV